MAFLGGAFIAAAAAYIYSRQIIQRMMTQNALALQNHQIEVQSQNQKIIELQQNLAHEQTRCATLEERASRLPTLDTQLTTVTRDKADLHAKTIELSSALEHERRQAQEKIALLEEAQR